MHGPSAVQDHVAGRQFHPFFIARLADHQFAAVVLGGVGQEQRCGEIGSDPERGTGYGPHRAIDMPAIGVPIRVTVE